MRIFYLVIPVSYAKQHLVIGPSLALLQGSGTLCYLMSDAPNVLMFLKESLKQAYLVQHVYYHNLKYVTFDHCNILLCIFKFKLLFLSI